MRSVPASSSLKCLKRLWTTVPAPADPSPRVLYQTPPASLPFSRQNFCRAYLTPTN